MVLFFFYVDVYNFLNIVIIFVYYPSTTHDEALVLLHIFLRKVLLHIELCGSKKKVTNKIIHVAFFLLLHNPLHSNCCMLTYSKTVPHLFFFFGGWIVSVKKHTKHVYALCVRKFLLNQMKSYTLQKAPISAWFGRGGWLRAYS